MTALFIDNIASFCSQHLLIGHRPCRNMQLNVGFGRMTSPQPKNISRSLRQDQLVGLYNVVNVIFTVSNSYATPIMADQNVNIL